MFHGVSAAEQAADDRTSLKDQERRIRSAALLHDVNDPPIWCDVDVSVRNQCKLPTLNASRDNESRGFP